MQWRGIKQRLAERRLSSISLRRSSAGVDADADADNTPSSPDRSRHHSRENTSAAHQRQKLLRSSSSLFSFSSNASDSASTTLQIDPATQALAVKAAEEKKSSFRESLPQSLLMSHDARDCVAPFQREEIVCGPKLGAGEFSNVFEVTSFSLDLSFEYQHRVEKFSIEELERKLAMKKGEKYRETKKARYAIKHIKPEYHQENDAKSYIQAASDLALEAELLASLQHPNIIKLRGIAQAGAAGFEQGPGGYFLVIDRLFDTLDQRMRSWRSSGRKSRLSSSLRRSISALPSLPTSSKPLDSKTKEEVIDERLSIAAMKYLHSHGIMYRDLKPANIGFDVRGDVKIFDFGLARVLPDSWDGNMEKYEMSGAGSPRYMAPECLKNEAYNLKADVYSFSIVLWELLSGQTPYAFVRRMGQLIQHVAYEDVRPEIDYRWPSAIQGMLESSFDADIDKRPKMTLWFDIIRQTLLELRGGDGQCLSESWVTRRRSFGSMKDVSQHQRYLLKDILAK